MIELIQESIKKSKSGKISGVIYLKLTDHFFPEEGWSDCPIILLNWWCEIFNSGKVGDYYFMDGPFYFKIINEFDSYYLEFFHNKVFLSSYKIDITLFKMSLLYSAKILLKTITINGWNTENDSDIKKLSQTLRYFNH
ncbi:hypothetical protein [Runella slithyformis]|uniref:Uncharacterized protein n=1 Tax=Runella slithyformis (strain ATCC 29530 / DSM 19594 / LMG 11500 / NCIMB 11436 / LSU 4) TaxID=761193 RepID=A0A7U3ZHV6_RUNSL|nr:hypothetical protein [Runella slithyformis]AEI47517.1 hypothetical protein Runsl_1086 [Runella slithyformis DSM 19594]